MDQKNRAHSYAVIQAAKLAGCSFWTSLHTSYYGPILHFVGILAIVPSLYMVVSSLGGWWSWSPWGGGGRERQVHHLLVWRLLPLNMFPFILCHGIPSLRAASVVGFLVGAGYCHDASDVHWNGWMIL